MFKNKIKDCAIWYVILLFVCAFPVLANYLMEDSGAVKYVEWGMQQGLTMQSITLLWQVGIIVSYLLAILGTSYSLTLIMGRTYDDLRVIMGTALYVTCPVIFYFSYDLSTIWGSILMISFPVCMGMLYNVIFEKEHKDHIKKIIVLSVFFTVMLISLIFGGAEIIAKGYKLNQLFSMYLYAPKHPGLGIAMLICLIYSIFNLKNKFRVYVWGIVGLLCLVLACKWSVFFYFAQYLLIMFGCLNSANSTDNNREKMEKWMALGVIGLCCAVAFYRANMFTYLHPPI